MMNNKFLVGFLVLLVGVGVGWYVFGVAKPKEEGTMEKTGGSAMPVPGTIGVEEMVVTETTPATSAAGGEKGGVMTKVTVTYTDSGYSPKEITVKKGTTVVFVNQSSGGMWTASAVHPTHQLLPGFDQLKSVTQGGMYEYQFVKAGTWKYHNHMKPTDFGSVVVTE